jgi:heme-degrading monooxygenase HmoA
MHFREEAVESFFRLFWEVYPRISTFPGCGGVKLLRDKNVPEIFFTYSTWNDENALEAYRKSELFADTWARTKALFAHRAAAWSVDEVSAPELRTSRA